MQKLFQVCKVLQSSKLVEYVFRLGMFLSSFFFNGRSYKNYGFLWVFIG